jgi:hypothetical protein
MATGTMPARSRSGTRARATPAKAKPPEGAETARGALLVFLMASIRGEAGDRLTAPEYARLRERFRRRLARDMPPT